jgi:hypothetical protein
MSYNQASIQRIFMAVEPSNATTALKMLKKEQNWQVHAPLGYVAFH